MEVANLEDLYELSPVQLGMLFHSLSAPESGVYVVQLSCTIQGAFNKVAFEKAWQWVVNSEPVLRTSFMWEELDKPIQLVDRHVIMPIHYDDWCYLAADEQVRQLEAFLVADCKQGFVLTKAPLMRLMLIRLQENAYRFIWSHHHLLLDGWSVSLIIQKVLSAYKMFCLNREVPIHYGRSYKEHIAWLQQQNISQSEQYWQQTLKGFTPLPLPFNKPAHTLTGESGGYGEEVLRLSATATAALLSLTRKYHLTMNTLLMGAWALLLSRYSGEDDIVFGTTVSGRSEMVAEIESMVGLFINTLPIRVQVNPTLPYIAWAGELQNLQIAINQHEYSSLTQIRQWSNLPQHIPLFESIFIFENYPLALALQEGNFDVSISDIHSRATTNYPLCLLGKLESEVVLWLQYDTNRFKQQTIRQMLGHLQTLLEAIASNPHECLARLPLLTEAETCLQLVDWNTTETKYTDYSICEIFESLVEQTP
ncbi:MAG: condensation domain-containing protein, partial [Ktedonobacteraceae bacterium]